jgi:hypothetical protein
LKKKIFYFENRSSPYYSAGVVVVNSEVAAPNLFTALSGAGVHVLEELDFFI